MSLFQAREYWTFTPDLDEECDNGCLVVGNVDNSLDGSDKIVTASFQGMLRVFKPSQRVSPAPAASSSSSGVTDAQQEATAGGYDINDLILETNLGAPVLQLALGRFIGHRDEVALAVLFTRKLLVFRVTASAVGGASTHHQLELAYEHKLERTACNMTYGPFGGVYNKDFLCVQSMDGQLSFFEQELVAFSRYLNSKFVVPGPLCYLPKSDCIVTINSAMEVEAYKYQVLSSSTNRPGGDAEDGAKQVDLNAASSPLGSKRPSGLGDFRSAKSVRPDWTLNLGEHALDMFTCKLGAVASAGHQYVDIVIVGETTLHVLREQGSVRLQKRLNYDPCAAFAFPASGSGSTQRHNLLVASHQDSLMVYKDEQGDEGLRLAWASRTTVPDRPPVALRTMQLGALRGMIVTLDDRGTVRVCYLGTTPPVHEARVDEGKALDYAAMDAEHQSLLKVIRQAHADAMAEPQDKLTLSCRLPDTVDTTSEHDAWMEPAARNSSGAVVSITATIYASYSGRSDLHNVALSIKCPNGITTTSTSVVLPHVRASTGRTTPASVAVRFAAAADSLPAGLSVKVVASFTTSENAPRTASLQLDLPLSLVGHAGAPVRNEKCLFVLDTNRPPPSLVDVFPDVLLPAIEENATLKRSAPNVMSFFYYGCDQDVTILVSKKGGRYRIQSGSLEALWVVSHDLVQRLHGHFANEDFVVSLSERLPLLDYFGVIDAHFGLRQKLAALDQQLDQAAAQMRLVQKRLLARFRDRNPAPLAGLDTLLEETYKRLQTLGRARDDTHKAVSSTATRLCCSTNLLLMLISTKNHLNEANSSMLRHYLSPIIDDNAEQGWEERTDAAISHLLRTALAKTKRETSQIAQPLKPLDNTSKFKKRIQVLCDRLEKGLRIV